MSKYSPEITQEIVKYLKAGNYIETVCDLVGINKSTFYDWRKKDPDFDNAIKKAMARSETNAVRNIRKAAIGGILISETTTTYPDGRTEEVKKYSNPQWQAEAWYLERTRPDKFGRQKLDINVTNIPLPAKPLDEMTDQELESYEQTIKSITSAPAREDQEGKN